MRGRCSSATCLRGSGCSQHKDMFPVLSGQVPERLIEGCQDEAFTHGKAQQKGVGDLVVSMESFAERLRQGQPVGRDRLVAVAGLLFQAREHRCDLFHAQGAGLGPGEKAEDAGLSKGA